MDPNTNLSEQLYLANRILSSSRTTDPTDSLELAELVIDLHEWILKGGYLPTEWEESRKHLTERIAPSVVCRCHELVFCPRHGKNRI